MRRRGIFFGCRFAEICIVSAMMGALMIALMILVPAPAIAVVPDHPMLQYDPQRTGNVSGIAPRTGTLLWQSHDGTSGCIQSGPVVYGDKVFISTWFSWHPPAKDGLYALNKWTGEEIWNNTGVSGASTAAIADGRLFLGTHNGYLASIDAETGEILWREKIEERPAWWGVASSPLIYNDTVYVLSFSTGTLHAFSFDGRELWNHSTGGSIFVYSSPAAYDGKIFFAGNTTDGQHGLYCIDIDTRNILWNFSVETEIRGSPTIGVEEGMVFFTTQPVWEKEHRLYAVNISTGEEVWNRTHFSSWASPALSHGRIFIGGSGAETTFFCFDARTGVLIWKNEEMGGAIDSSPVVADGKVFFGIQEVDGTVYALCADTGNTIWSYTRYTPEGFGGGFNVASHPAVVNGTLFIGMDNVGVLAFRDPDPEVLWEGEVILVNDTTFVFTASNPPYNTYVINTTTCMGALYATGLSFNASDVWYPVWGTFSIESIGGIVNEPWAPGARSWSIWLNGELAPTGLSGNDLVDGDNLRFYFLPWCGETFAPLRDQATYLVNIDVTILPVVPIFDTGAPDNPFPSIAGTHTGTIRPTYTVHATRLYTYAIEGTGGHTKFARIGNETWNITATWGGFVGDWRYITFDEPVILLAGKTYSFEIITGSYPQIHHTPALPTANGWINCTGFVDVNGREHQGWIPAIRLE
ncbi:MAG: PQQ-binding-like beta-propeller repeat protein [Methanophagales archaeon]|nr:PQQ-binding-like beta-propeller repeat protein [Methanophagales archaeon]